MLKKLIANQCPQGLLAGRAPLQNKGVIELMSSGIKPVCTDYVPVITKLCQ